MNNSNFKIVNTIEEYQQCINKVRETKEPIKLKLNNIIEYFELLNTNGVEIIISDECDEIKILE